MGIKLHAHAIERLFERGATEEEVRITVEDGESFPAKYGRHGFRRNFAFDGFRRGRKCTTKQIEAYAIREEDSWLVITASALARS